MGSPTPNPTPLPTQAPTLSPTPSPTPCDGSSVCYSFHASTNCIPGKGAGNFRVKHPVGTGVEKCKALCNALPYGIGDNHCSLIVVRSNGQCYLKDGPVDISQCEDQGPTKDTYVRLPPSPTPSPPPNPTPLPTQAPTPNPTPSPTLSPTPSPTPR